MSFVINRLVKDTDRNGNPETFLELAINDDLGAYAYGKWLNPVEQEMFVSDESTINVIAESLIPAAHIQRARSIAAENTQSV